MQGAQPIRNLAAWLAVFFLVVLGAKLWTIQLWATNIPYWDQWDEARLLFKPWLEGTLGWHDFFIPHNEHRIVFTRLLDLLEVKLNGQWDPVFQMVVNAVIHIGYGWLLATVIWSLTGRKHAGLICCALIPFFALPFAGENTTQGFQSQMYFVNIFSVAAILGLGFSRPAGGIWFCGLVVAVLSIFTMASGFLAAASLIGLVLLRALKERRLAREKILTILACAAVVALGLALKVGVARHQILQAHSLPVFLGVLLGNLAWPFRGQPVMALVIALPLVLLAVKYFQPDFKNARAAEFVLVFALWAVIQAMALAFGRALLPDASRYLDTMSTLPMAAAAALFVLAMDYDFRRLPKKAALMLAVLWSAVVLAGLGLSSSAMFGNYLDRSRAWGLLETENVRAFVATGDAGWLKSKMELAVPYWNSDWLTDLLRQPKILSIMPADARPPLRPAPDETLSSGFFTNGCPPARPVRPFTETWGNFSTNGLTVAGHFTSRPMSASLPKLSVQVFHGPADISIRLTGADGRAVELHPKFEDRWETLIVDAPRSPFILSVEKAADGAPAAIGEIKELGRFSVFAQGLIGQAVLVLSIGLGLGIIFTVAAGSRPGVSLNNEGLAWLLVLVVLLAALAGAVCCRNFDSDAYSCALQKRWAVEYVNAGHPARAQLHLREALWLKPDDAEAGKELGILMAHGGNDPLP